MNIKWKVYALFQFLSLIGIILFLSGIFLLFVNAGKNDEILKPVFWKIEFMSLLKFSSQNVSLFFGSILIYLSFAFIIASWIFGLLIYGFKARNYYDTMFSIFIPFPLIANLFCLLAQLFLKETNFKNPRLDKEEMEQEKTQILKILYEERALNNNITRKTNK